MLMRAALVLSLACFTLGSAYADQSHRMKLSMRVGQTKRIIVLAAHNADCSSSDAKRVEVIQAPTLGAISQQENVPVVTRQSLSGTCVGSRVEGTAVDYTASAPGTDHLQFDGVFSNGRAHYDVTVVNR